MIFSCGISTNAPSWTDIGSDGVYVEVCNDTLTQYQIDSTLNAAYKDWDKMTYYNSSTDSLVQWTTVKNDTVYNVTRYEDKFIYNVKTTK